MKDFAKNIFIFFSIVLLVLCVHEFRKWKLKNESVKSIEHKNFQQNQGKTTANNDNVDTYTKKNDMPLQLNQDRHIINIFYDLEEKSEDRKSGASNQFESILFSTHDNFIDPNVRKKSPLLKFVKGRPEDSKEALTIQDIFVKFYLTKIDNEKWRLEIIIKNANDAKEETIKHIKELFPRGNILPGYKIFYTEKQIGQIMGRFAVEEILKFQTHKIQLNKMILPGKDLQD